MKNFMLSEAGSSISKSRVSFDPDKDGTPGEAEKREAREKNYEKLKKRDENIKKAHEKRKKLLKECSFIANY